MVYRPPFYLRVCSLSLTLRSDQGRRHCRVLSITTTATVAVDVLLSFLSCAVQVLMRFVGCLCCSRRSSELLREGNEGAVCPSVRASPGCEVRDEDDARSPQSAFGVEQSFDGSAGLYYEDQDDRSSVFFDDSSRPESSVSRTT